MHCTHCLKLVSDWSSQARPREQSLPTSHCIWSVCSQVDGLYTDTRHLEMASSSARTSWKSAHILYKQTLCLSAAHTMIPADSSRRVTAGTETKVEHRQVTPSRSNVVLKNPLPSPLVSSEISLSVFNCSCRLVLYPFIKRFQAFQTQDFTFPNATTSCFNLLDDVVIKILFQQCRAESGNWAAYHF